MSGENAMSLKNEIKRDLRNLMKDVELEAERKWSATYEGHEIVVQNGMKEETLLVDHVVIAQNTRSSLWSHVIPYVTLKGSFTTSTGETKHISAKIGGLIKFNCTIKIDGQKVLTAVEKFDLIPWKHKEPIMPFIQQQLREHGKLVTDALPDDAYVYDEHHPKIAPGLADQLNDDVTLPFFVKKLVKLVENQTNHPTEKTRAKTYEEVTGDTIASYFESFVEQFEQRQLDEEAVQKEAFWLLENGADREVVKFALVLLGCTSCDAYRSFILEIGQHEEFTAYAAFALDNGCSDSEEGLFELAKNTYGWGRMHAIEYLKGSTEEIRQWLLTEGYYHNGMEGYSAFECVDKGQLVDIVAAETISSEMYEHANTLLQYVLNHKAAGGSIEEVDRGAALLTHFVRHAQTHCTSLTHFYTVTLIERFLEEEDYWQQLYEEEWVTEAEHRTLQQAVRLFTDDRKWLSEAVDVLDVRFDRAALEITTFYQLNVAAKLFEHLLENPKQIAIYESIMMSGVQQDVAELCQIATNVFHFDQLTEEDEACLQVIFENLYMYDVVGLPLIEKALISSTRQTQLEALMALTYWEHASWNNERMRLALTTLAKQTEDKEVRKLTKQLLKS